MLALAPLPSVKTIHERLAVIFGEGISDRNYLIREMAAKTIFTMLYVDAIEGGGVWIAPKQIVKMSDKQAKKQEVTARQSYFHESAKSGFHPLGQPWYSDNTREPIRDETLRQGLVAKGAAVMRHDLATTSSKGRYALKKEFAQLFLLSKGKFKIDSLKWADKYLTAAELARVTILRTRSHSSSDVVVNFPNGENRTMSAGPSSVITKAVVEEFAKRHLVMPAVVWLSESGKKVFTADDELMRGIGLPLDQQRLLPDIVLADLGREKTLLIFVEVVATDGPVTESRKNELLNLTASAGYPRDQVVFISAFTERGSSPLKARFSGIAVDSLIWCMTEPDLLIWLGENQEMPFNLKNNII